MTESFKILPAVMVASFVLLIIKGVGLWAGIQTELSGAAQAKVAVEAPVEEHDDVEAGAEVEATDSVENGALSLLQQPDFMTQSEIEVLQALAARREKLDARAVDLDLRDKLFLATERRVEEKIAELKSIEERIGEMLGLRDEEEQAQLMSLVKVYETMKAKDAARIFELLETEILLDVAGRMKEQKIASILAAMNPNAAQDLTVRLVKRRELPKPEGALDLPIEELDG